ncbi:hypothetical protein CsSME_00019292 [Camellia sinensis var. sinensis]
MKNLKIGERRKKLEEEKGVIIRSVIGHRHELSKMKRRTNIQLKGKIRKRGAGMELPLTVIFYFAIKAAFWLEEDNNRREEQRNRIDIFVIFKSLLYCVLHCVIFFERNLFSV